MIVIEEIIKNLYITTCGRIFNKNSRFKAIKSFETTPSTKSNFNRFLKNNNLNIKDFTIIDSGERNKHNAKLYYFKYIYETPLYPELHGSIDSDGYKILSYNGKQYKWHRVVMYYFSPIKNYYEMQVNHIIPIKTLNSINNLEWCTALENIRHSIKNNLRSKIRKPYKKESEDKLFNPDLNWSKTRIRNFLLRRNLRFDDYIFIETGIIKEEGNRKIGYLKKK